jgi:hypothetical protein
MKVVIRFLDGRLAGRQYASDSRAADEAVLANAFYCLSGEGKVGRRVAFHTADEVGSSLLEVAYSVSRRQDTDGTSFVDMTSVASQRCKDTMQDSLPAAGQALLPV